MSEDVGPRLQQAAAAIDGGIVLLDRLRRDVIEMEAKLKAENERLRARIVELEAELALLRGTLGSSPAPDTPTQYTLDIPPDAPR